MDVSDFVEVGAAFESAAVQQLVWTATAADKAVTKVQLLVNGETPPSGHSDWSQPVGRANSLTTLADVWILQPAERASVSSPVTIRVYGTGFEGNVPIKVFRDGTLVVATNVTTQMGGFAVASTRVRLPKGSYVVKAYNDNGQDASLSSGTPRRSPSPDPGVTPSERNGRAAPRRQPYPRSTCAGPTDPGVRPSGQGGWAPRPR